VLLGNTVLEIEGILLNEEGTSVRAVDVRALGAVGSEAGRTAAPSENDSAPETPPSAQPAAISYSRDFCR